MTSKRERLQAALAGQVADRPPVALWRHFPVDDQSPRTMVAAVLAFQREMDFDFIKVTPASSYCVRDWGVEDRWEGSTEGTRSYTRRVVKQATDWEDLHTLAPNDGALGEHLACLREIAQVAPDDVPIVATVFSPLAQAKNLAGQAVLDEHLRTEPKRVLAGLRTIASTAQLFIAAARLAGIDGIFYAIQHASPDLLGAEAYARFGLPFDQAILDAAGDLWLNLLHLHGAPVDFDVATKLPAPVVNWHDRETPPDLREGRRRSGKTVCGGLARIDTLVLGDPDRIRAEAREAIRQTDGGLGLILGTGCVVPIHAPRGNLLAARQAVETSAP